MVKLTIQEGDAADHESICGTRNRDVELKRKSRPHLAQLEKPQEAKAAIMVDEQWCERRSPDCERKIQASPRLSRGARRTP